MHSYSRVIYALSFSTRGHYFKFRLKNDKVALDLLHVWEACTVQDSLSVTVTPRYFHLSICSSIWLPSKYYLDIVFELLAFLIILHLEACRNHFPIFECI